MKRKWSKSFLLVDSKRLKVVREFAEAFQVDAYKHSAPDYCVNKSINLRANIKFLLFVTWSGKHLNVEGSSNNLERN